MRASFICPTSHFTAMTPNMSETHGRGVESILAA